jgi:nitrite reductase/ring-hydroxylating ferredoxin subunit
MESFDTASEDSPSPPSEPTPNHTIVAGRAEDLRPGRCTTLALPDGNELAVYNVDGDFFATENSCPHHGAPLAEGCLRGYLIECGWHGWQFDVRDGRCLTVNEPVATYRVLVENGLIKVEIQS